MNLKIMSLKTPESFWWYVRLEAFTSFEGADVARRSRRRSFVFPPVGSEHDDYIVCDMTSHV